jgi:hypothetical protein
VGGCRRSTMGADVRWRSGALGSALLRFFDTVMPDDQEIFGALEEILTLLRKYGAGQAEYVAELLELLSGSRERFRESVLDNAVWGGAGSLVDVSLWSIRQDDEAMRDHRRLIAAILRLAEGLRNAGLADDRVLERAALLSKIKERDF